MTNFYLDTHPDKKGDCAIRVSFRAKSARLLTSIGYGIHPDKWDADKMQVRPGTEKSPAHNSKGIPAATINARIAAIKAAFSTLEATPGALSVEAARAQLDAITGKAEKKAAAARHNQGQEQGPKSEVLAYFQAFLREEGRAQQWTTGTLQIWHAFGLHLKAYKPALKFSDFDEKGLAKFIEHLRYKSNEGEGLKENTAKKHYANLKWFLNWAARKGVYTETAIKTFRPKFKVLAKPVIFLTRQELLRLYSFEIPANGTIVKLKTYGGKKYTKKVEDAGALAKARDLFCFCAFTSLRYSDMAALKRTNICGDALELTTKKTNDRLTIPLNNYSRAILDKYKDLKDPAGRALPVITNQKMNGYLKDLCELCGFNDPITNTYYRAGNITTETAPKWSLIGTHAARRTFICYALTKGIAPQIIMKFTGHSDYKSMKPYIDIAGTDAAAAMQLMND
ncbi:MAG: site-specific integrase [Bacteroidales bacterium]|nr:site-specific integrase [Candidatus Cryptobacteroides caccocaballi]